MTRRKDGRWQEKIKIGEKYVYVYGKSKAEVLRKIREYEEITSSALPLSKAIDLWLAEKEKSVSYKTLEGYNAPIKRIKEAFGDRAMDEITPAQIQSFIRGIAAKGYKRTTVQRPLDVLRMIYDFYITQPNSKIQVNPCTSVKLPSGLEQQRRDLISKEDADLVRNGVHCTFGLFAFFLMYTGLREGEALALTDADFSDNEISVTKSLSWQPNQPVIKEPKTKKSIRKVIVLPPLAAVLPKWKGYLFSADGGKSPLTNTQFRHQWKAYCIEAGLAEPEEVTRYNKKNNRYYTSTSWNYKIVPHQLRHEFATICLDAGLETIDAQHLLGHASDETTKKVYMHIRESRRLNTYDKLTEYVKTM